MTPPPVVLHSCFSIQKYSKAASKWRRRPWLGCAVLIGQHIMSRSAAYAMAVTPRVISDCHFAVKLNHFIPDFRSYSVAVFLK